jgi:hypothetical protein
MILLGIILSRAMTPFAYDDEMAGMWKDQKRISHLPCSPGFALFVRLALLLKQQED